MGNPRIIFIRVPDTPYSLEVDLAKFDCLREKPHCHVCKGVRNRVGQIWLDSCMFAYATNISTDDKNRILSTVHRNLPSLNGAYMYNRKNGHD